MSQSIAINETPFQWEGVDGNGKKVKGKSLAQSEAAVRAAQSVELELTKINLERQREEKPLIRHGVGLHRGIVNYGNVGSPDRLDFTVIGPAVNMAARIEGLCGSLEQKVLMSEDVAEQVSVPTVCLGAQALKGVTSPIKVYGLANTSDSD